MSSYELLELLEFMPDKGAFKTAVRKGEYSEDEIIWRHIANRLSRIESITYVQATRKPGEPLKMFYTKGELREMIAEEEHMAESREDFFSFADRAAKVPEVI